MPSMRISTGMASRLKLNDHRNECAVYLEPEVLHVLTGVLQTVFTT